MLSIDAMESALEKAKANVGGAAGMARLLGGITSQAISQWKKVPPSRVLDVERISGVSRHELRPDMYPLADDASAPSEAGEAA